MFNISLLGGFRPAPFVFLFMATKAGFLATYTLSNTQHKALVKG
jgi:hypothetical protein